MSQTVTISQDLTDLVAQLANAMHNTTELMKKVVNQAKAEGLTAAQTRELIVAALKNRKLSDRTISRYLPDELKDQVKKESGSVRQTSADNLSADNQRDTKAGGGGGGLRDPPNDKEPAIPPAAQVIFSQQHSRITELELELGREKEQRLAQEAKAKEQEQRADELEYRKDQVEQKLQELGKPQPENQPQKWWADFAIDMDNGNVFCGKVQVDCANRKVHAVFDPKRSGERNPK